MITCWDAVQMVLEDTAEEFAPFWKEDPEKKDILREYCVAIGYIAGRAGSTCLRTNMFKTDHIS